MTHADLASRIVISLLLGAIIGFERQWHRRLAGLRTNALVAIGSAGFVIIGALMTGENSPTRIAAQVASGIGFLGAGVILREGLSVRGLNTAATLWCSAAVGSLAGLGFNRGAVLTTGAVIMTNLGLRPLARYLDRVAASSTEMEIQYRVEVVCRARDEARLRDLLLEMVARGPLILRRVRRKEEADSDNALVEVMLISDGRQHDTIEQIARRLSGEPGVTSVTWESAEERTDY
jgi:putative Mg2+ transporter-C (MgtC) family protein